MSVQTVLVSSDQNVLGLLPSALRSAGISVDIYRCSQSVLPAMTGRGIAGLILDCPDYASASAVLKRLRESPANRNALTVLVTDDQVPLIESFKLGAALVLRKPLSRDKVRMSIKALRNLVLHEKRRLARESVAVPLQMRCGRRAIQASTLDLSEAGLGFQAGLLPLIGDSVEAVFTLPGTDARISVTGTVRWVNSASSRGGLKFSNVSDPTRLRNWLDERFEEERVSNLVNAEVCFKD
jgi:FixJ family two-component response regulator